MKCGTCQLEHEDLGLVGCVAALAAALRHEVSQRQTLDAQFFASFHHSCPKCPKCRMPLATITESIGRSWLGGEARVRVSYECHNGGCS